MLASSQSNGIALHAQEHQELHHGLIQARRSLLGSTATKAAPHGRAELPSLAAAGGVHSLHPAKLLCMAPGRGTGEFPGFLDPTKIDFVAVVVLRRIG